MSESKRKDGHKDKFDENTESEGMGPIENEDVSEETGIIRRKKKDKGGEGTEEFIDDRTNFRHGEDYENQKDY